MSRFQSFKAKTLIFEGVRFDDHAIDADQVREENSLMEPLPVVSVPGILRFAQDDKDDAGT